jgi:hypothetical protein
MGAAYCAVTEKPPFAGVKPADISSEGILLSELKHRLKILQE